MNTETKHPACIECIATRKKRFGDDWNKLKCSGIKVDYLDEYPDAQLMPEEDKLALRTLLDPYLWGCTNFNLNPRDYQEVMTNCTSTMKVFRTGRRVGKTEVMLINALHRMMLNKNKKVLLFTPYETQIRVFFNRIQEWMDKSPMLSQAKKRFVQSPFTFELYNGSSLIGFTTGTKSGMKSASARGQEADIIILDEADYLTRDDLTAILPMLQKTDETSIEDKELWCASTPTGRHDFFYEWANSSAFKEFHHASWINPAWNAEEEARSHDLFPNETDWEHEYAAEWGEEKEGVYSQAYIERAVALSRTLLGNDGRWDYKKQIPKGGCTYTIGVDWNSSANGVQIVVAEMDPMLITSEDMQKGIRNRFRIATRVDVDSKEFTQTKAVQKIIELNRIWNPKAIYVDEGYGMTQIEDLRRYAHKHPESKILSRLKGINFSSMHEVKDPANKTTIKKPMKPFMVNNAVRYFEDNVILLNKSDTEFEKQLRDYTVAKRSREGRPVYSEGNDHILDAFNLAILAFTMEFSDLGKPVYTSNMHMTGPMGEKRVEQRIDENGDLKIVDRTKELKPLVKPRQIPLTDMDGRRLNRSFNMGQYNSARHNRPIKRSI